MRSTPFDPLLLLRVVAPVLQALVRLAVGVAFGRVLLRQVPLVVGHHLAHVRDVVVLVPVRLALRVLLEDLDDLAAAGRPNPSADRIGSDRIGGRDIDRSRERCTRGSDNGPPLPLVPDRLARVVTLAPSGPGRLLALEPFLELVGGHVDELVEFPARAGQKSSNHMTWISKGSLTR